ncbi:MAG: MarR family winged helix-turn-helix transcriptional regulator [Cetobacterium sp.]|uniref:MarR family winged helix-turn-helix transcriptional regulator n=1 Tax=Cetobacterium sp. TaxID=2071632 RepID=UPI0025C4A1FD|nr:MarR family transcriptional regulator [Cetobacterium sp.]
MDKNIAFLISKLSRYQKKYLNNYLKNTDLEDSQAIILIKIKEHVNLTPKEIFEMRIVEKPSVTKILKKLEELKYIEKVYSNNDGRSYSVVVTDKGNKMCLSIEKIIQSLNLLYEKIASQQFLDDLTKILDEIYDEYI